jgi:hypothetical protein
MTDWAAHYAKMSFEELGGKHRMESNEQEAAFDTEVKKRFAQKAAQQRASEERVVNNKRRKDALPYSESLATEICERISAGELLTVICLDEHLPTVRRCNAWLRDHGDFAALYQQSLQDRLAIFEEQLIQIPDEVVRDLDITTKGNNTKRTLDPAKVTAAKLRVEVRRLHLKAMRPEKWGETSTLITKSADDNDLSNMSEEELERRIAELELKDRIFKKNDVFGRVA